MSYKTYFIRNISYGKHISRKYGNVDPLIMLI
jgi:hypothetical protein